MTDKLDRRTVLSLASVWPFTGRMSAEQPLGRLDRNNLSLYRDESGAARPVRTVRDWFRRRSEIIAGMQSVMGRLPGPEKRCPLSVRIEEEVDAGTHLRRLLTYDAE